MAGAKFLNSILKIVLCAVGMTVMGYALYPSIEAEKFADALTIVRGLVFLGFGYLFVQSIRELLGQRKP